MDLFVDNHTPQRRSDLMR